MLLLIIVIALISATVTSVFARSVRRDAFRAAEAGAVFENGRIETLASNAGALAVVLANIQGVPQLVASRSQDLKKLAIQDQSAGGFLERADFLAFFSADRQYLGLSATAGPDRPPNLDDSDVVTLSGSVEVMTALQGRATYSVDDIGLGHSKLALIGAAPVFAPSGGSGNGNTVVGPSRSARSSILRCSRPCSSRRRRASRSSAWTARCSPAPSRRGRGRSSAPR